MQELDNFIARGLETLQKHVKREDFKTLLRVLGVMLQINKRAAYADNIFKPLRDIITLLKTYSVELNAQMLKDIDQLPQQWRHLKYVAAQKSEALQDTKIYQQQRVTGIIIIFTSHINCYAKEFQQKAVRFLFVVVSIYDI